MGHIDLSFFSKENNVFSFFWGTHCAYHEIIYIVLDTIYIGWIKLFQIYWASLVAQWLRIHLPMQGTQVQALGQEGPTCHGETKPVRHNYWACALEPANHNYLSPCATTTEAHVPRARALQQEKPLQSEAHAPQNEE